MRTLDQKPSENLAELRIRAGHTARSLARHARVAPNTIANAEHGSIPTVETQIKIAAALGVDRFDLWPINTAVLAA